MVAVAHSGAYSFTVIGDWGRDGKYKQRDVAEAMGAVCTARNCKFVVSTGDNFYPGGVSSVSDSQWLSSFESVYNQRALASRWYVVLGNHDYIQNPDAEVQYTNHSSRWYLPSRYYSTELRLPPESGNATLGLWFLDTTPLADMPASSPPPPNVAAQLTWLRDSLSSSTANWKLVFGHHTDYSAGGHGNTQLFVSGAGSQTRNDVNRARNDLIWAYESSGFMLVAFDRAGGMRVEAYDDAAALLYTTYLWSRAKAS